MTKEISTVTRYRALEPGEHEFYLRVIVQDRVSDEAIWTALDDAPAEVYCVPQPPQGAVSAEQILAPRAVTAAHDLMKGRGIRAGRENVADMLAEAYRVARGQ